jgi:hypothetical protein
MENTAIVLIVLTNVALVVILGLLTFLIYRLFQQKIPKDTGETSSPSYHPAIVARLKELQKIKPGKRDLFCPNHPDEPGETTCAICDKLFCKACVKPFKTLHFCKEHLPLLMRHEWEEILTLKTSTDDPEQGVRLYDLKKELFQTEDIPTYVETHYKINVDQDYIETYLVLFSMKEKAALLRDRFREFSTE